MSATQNEQTRGRLIDLGERRLNWICAGPPQAGGALVLLEAGAFGLSADYGAIQAELAARGIRSCAYDRAGMGRSDPRPGGPTVRSTVEDLETALSLSGEAGPYVLVGHSMAGLRVRQFAGRNPEKVAGIVLLDATPPEAIDLKMAQTFINGFGNISRLAAFGASVGLFKPLAPFIGDRIGLPPEASGDKRHAFGSGQHNRTAAQEVLLWNELSQDAKALPPFDPAWPIGIVTAGPVKGREMFTDLKVSPAKGASFAVIEHLQTADHAGMLGLAHASSVVDVIVKVRNHTGAGT